MGVGEKTLATPSDPNPDPPTPHKLFCLEEEFPLVPKQVKIIHSSLNLLRRHVRIFGLVCITIDHLLSVSTQLHFAPVVI